MYFWRTLKCINPKELNFIVLGSFVIIYLLLLYDSIICSSVAAWLSETVLRGRGPGASGFESHRRGRIFSKEGTSAGPWMCVYV
jgi:hypothetical protein